MSFTADDISRITKELWWLDMHPSTGYGGLFYPQCPLFHGTPGRDARCLYYDLRPEVCRGYLCCFAKNLDAGVCTKEDALDSLRKVVEGVQLNKGLYRAPLIKRMRWIPIMEKYNEKAEESG